MQLFLARELRAAKRYALKGGQALHLMPKNFVVPKTAPLCFRQAKQIAHLFDQDAKRLRRTAASVGLPPPKIYIHREGAPSQHVDLCGRPLTRCITACKPHRRWLRSHLEQQELARTLLDDLRTHKHSIGLVPAPDPKHAGHKIRVVTERNPEWYSLLAGRKGLHKRRGRNRNGCLRKKVVRALRRLSSGWYDPIGLEYEILETAVPLLIEAGELYPGSEGKLLLQGLPVADANDYVEKDDIPI